MPGKHLGQRRDRYIALRARGLPQHEAMKIADISRPSAARIERSPELQEALKPYEPPPRPVKSHEEPPREMPLEVALRLLNGLRNVSDPQAIEVVLDTVKDVVPPEVVADVRKELLGPTAMAPDGADGFITPPPAPEPDDDPDPTRYGPLSAEYLPQSLGHNQLPKRTFSLNDRRLGFVFEDHALAARAKPQGSSRPLRFWQS
jgi:hypothetical protein